MSQHPTSTVVSTCASLAAILYVQRQARRQADAERAREVYAYAADLTASNNARIARIERILAMMDAEDA